jgi:Flp pilus assembly protein TadG
MIRTLHTNDEGAVIVIVAVSIAVLIAFVGLALDIGQIYVTKQKAQSAADAAALAGVMDLYNDTSARTTNFGRNTITCPVGSSSPITPCYYANVNGFGATSADSVVADFPACGSSTVSCSTLPPNGVNLIRVSVQRTVNTTLLGAIGLRASTVQATAIAAILYPLSAVPIIITHPTLSGALSINGTGSVGFKTKICGGPTRSIQVNSTDSGAVSISGGGLVDLSQSTCSPVGTGADFAVVGGPSSPTAVPSWLSPVGTTEHYVQPASVIRDPLASVPTPTAPAAAPSKTPLANGMSGCPASPPKPCNLYYPGSYSSGINVQNETAVFAPGLYYMRSGSGFSGGANSAMYMCTTCALDTTINATQPGMVVFNSGGGTFNVGGNGSINLVGSDAASVYKQILFFEDRFAPAQIGSHGHTIGGGGNVNLIGTLYLTNCASYDPSCSGNTMTPSLYQQLTLSGNPSNTTSIQGQIITSSLVIKGSGTVQMYLGTLPTLNVRQVALVK